jgi:hypothetical protein
VVEEGALADLLLVEGNPLENFALVADPDRNFRVITQGRPDLQEHPAVTTAGRQASGDPAACFGPEATEAQPFLMVPVPLPSLGELSVVYSKG